MPRKKLFIKTFSQMELLTQSASCPSRQPLPLPWPTRLLSGRRRPWQRLPEPCRKVTQSFDATESDVSCPGGAATEESQPRNPAGAHGCPAPTSRPPTEQRLQRRRLRRGQRPSGRGAAGCAPSNCRCASSGGRSRGIRRASRPCACARAAAGPPPGAAPCRSTDRNTWRPGRGRTPRRRRRKRRRRRQRPRARPRPARRQQRPGPPAIPREIRLGEGEGARASGRGGGRYDQALTQPHIGRERSCKHGILCVCFILFYFLVRACARVCVSVSLCPSRMKSMEDKGRKHRPRGKIFKIQQRRSLEAGMSSAN